MIAAAISIFVVPLALPVAPAAGAATLTILAPAAGATVTDNVSVLLRYVGHSPSATNVSGYVRIDGEPVATFVRPTSELFNVSVDLTNVSRGEHVLSAVAFTDLDLPTEAAPVAFNVNHAPTAILAAWYDADVLHLEIEASDDGAGSVSVAYSTPLGNGSFLAAGPVHVELPGYLRPGIYEARFILTDTEGGMTRATRGFSVADRPLQVEITRAEYLNNGTAIIEGTARDGDGLRSELSFSGVLRGKGIVTNGTFTANVTLNRTAGETTVGLIFRDNASSPTRVNVSIAMVARHVVAYEMSIRGIGADAGFETPRIPWLHNATVTICVDFACRPEQIVLASSNAFVQWGPLGPGIEARTCAATWKSARCGFSSEPGSIAVGWQRASPAPLSIRIEGWTID